MPPSLVAQQKIPQTFQYRGEATQEGGLRAVTQMSYPNAAAIRLYFEDVQLGRESYLLLEGADGARQKLDAEALKNWHNSSAYFNGGHVKVSVHQAPGDPVTFSLKEISVNNGDTDGQAARRRKTVTPSGSGARSGEFNEEDMPHAAAVGRFTNGSSSDGTGWIAPNGAIVTSSVVRDNIEEGYDVIEFNVPPSNEDGSVNHPEPQHQYPVITTPHGDNNATAFFGFKNSTGYEAVNEPGLGIAVYRTDWAIVEALPNGTGLTPGERQQQYFRIASNPGSFTLEATDVEVDILHYGSYPEDVDYPEDYKTLRSTTTKLLLPKEYIRQTVAYHPKYIGDMPKTKIDREEMVIYHGKNDDPFSSAMGAPITYHQSNVAIGVHHTFYYNAPAGAIGFKEGLLRHKLNNFFTSNVVYVDAEGLYGDQSTGEIHKPYVALADGVNSASENAVVYIAKGSYNEQVIITTPMTLKAPVGKVRIGTSGGGNSSRTASAVLPPGLFTHEEGDAFEETEEKPLASSIRSYPNPFTDHMALHYFVEQKTHVSAKVFDIMGREVKTLVDEQKPFGAHSVVWDGRDLRQRPAKSGIYIVKLQKGAETSTFRIIKK